MKKLAYEPYEALSGRPHVMVDGAPRQGSVLTLSHWPQSPTPAWLARDLSAEIVLALLRPASSAGTGQLAEILEAWDRAEAVTNDHFDTDGVMSVFAVVEAESALSIEIEQRLVGAARCGDFGVVTDDLSAQVAFAVEPLATKEAGEHAGTSERYAAVIPIVGELLRAPDRYVALWRDDFAALERGRTAIRNGEVTIVEHAASDFAVVAREAGAKPSGGRLPGADGGFPVMEEAVYSSTPASRVLAFDRDRCELRLRYEGWVRLVSRRVPMRPDLAPLAEMLSAEEPSGTAWEANGVGAIIGLLRPGGEGRTEIPPGRVVAVVEGYLHSAAPAWDPFRPGGGYIPAGERAPARG